MPIYSGPARPHLTATAQTSIGAERVGVIWGVPCPWCGRKIDFRPQVGQEHGGTGEGSIGFEIGATYTDRDTEANGRVVGCGKAFRIADITRATMVKVQPVRLAPKK